MKEMQSIPAWMGNRQKESLAAAQQQRENEEIMFWQDTAGVLGEQLEMMTDDCQTLQLAIIGLLLSGTVIISLMAGLVMDMI